MKHLFLVIKFDSEGNRFPAGVYERFATAESAVDRIASEDQKSGALVIQCNLNHQILMGQEHIVYKQYGSEYPRVKKVKT
jgi:hypothetical protein